MLSRRALGATTVAIVLGAVGLPAVAAVPAQAAGPAFDAGGTARCAVTGKAKLKPRVTNAPAVGVVWSFTGKLACSTGTTGNGSVTVVGGSVKMSSAPSTRSCTATPLPAVTAAVRWKAVGGRVNPTRITWSGGATSTSGSRFTEDLPGGGTAVVTGSYAGTVGSAHLLGDVVSFADCGGKGLKGWPVSTSSTLTVTGGPPPVCDNGQAAPARYQSVVVFSFENRRWSDVGGVGFRSMPYLAGLAQSCSFFSSWTEANPAQNSLSQYGGQVTGAFQPGLVNDCSPSATCSTTANNIFRQARVAGRTAVNYVEGATMGCSAGTNAAKHIPDLYLWSADDRAACSAQTRPYSEFDPSNPPSFAFITPSQCNDGHDCANKTVDAWARTNVSRVLDSAGYKAGRVAVFIWYDEDSPVPNLQIAPTAKPGPFATSGIGYASTLKAWESMLGLPCLANACTAPDLRAVAGL